ncbi:MAG: hypothetical protein FJ091_06870 [Deltaproteobacteria bacterium]|nr:hypothetical protein [Deltaproteobacteria bacterium]
MVPLHVAIPGFVVALTALHLWAHFAQHGVFNWNHAVLACFLVVNFMINLWELVLHGEADQITREYEATRQPYKGREAVRAAEYFTSSVPLSKLFLPRTWTGVWSSYALYDPGYADRRSFGWNIDVGNAWSTVIPAGIFAWGMTFDLLSPRLLGALGVAVFWQMFYGTCVYFFQFFNNKRHVGHSVASIFAVVVCTNVLWFVFPLWALALCVNLIETNSLAIFR